MNYKVTKFKRDGSGKLISRAAAPCASPSDGRRVYRETIGRLTRGVVVTDWEKTVVSSVCGVTLSLDGTVLESWGIVE